MWAHGLPLLDVEICPELQGERQARAANVSVLQFAVKPHSMKTHKDHSFPSLHVASPALPEITDVVGVGLTGLV